MEIFEEKDYKIRTNKNNEMDLFLRNINNEELSITLFTNYPSKKYELKCNLEEFQKNRFFKIFINIEEIMKELENKIEKSIFIEDTNCIIIEIKIGLTIINEILLVIEEQEKNKDEIIEELQQQIQILNNKLKDAENKIKLNEEKEKKEELKQKVKLINDKLKEKDYKLKDSENKIKLKEEIEKNEELKLKIKILNDKLKEKDNKLIYTNNEINLIENKINNRVNEINEPNIL